jgi:hypothetical protein
MTGDPSARMLDRGGQDLVYPLIADTIALIDHILGA